jgi:DNA recombination protein RmuC
MKPLEIVLIVIIVVLLLALTGMFVLNFFKPSKKVDASSSEAKNKLEDILIQNQKLQAQLDMMQKTYIALNETINKTGMDSSKNIAFLSEKIETLDKYQKDLNKFNTEIKTNLENIHTTTKNIPSISSEIKGISDIYKNSKHRGNFGEIQLKLIFDDIFGNNPDFVQGQYKIKTGAVVDYIIKIGDHIVPIDSKFPLDNYRKANEAKNEIEITHAKQLFKKDIVAKFKEVIKYVNPKEGIENAIVFIPSEVMFADILA